MNTMNLNRCVLLALAVSAISSPAFARHPKPNGTMSTPSASSSASIPLVTRDNFVSLLMHTTGGIANVDTLISVENQRISRFVPEPVQGQLYGGYGGGETPPYQPFPRYNPLTASGFLSGNQLNVVLRALNETRFPLLAGKYQQQHLADGLHETVTLTLSDEQNRDRTFIVENIGNAAPRAYYEFTSRLRAFVALKLPEPPKSQAPLAQPFAAQPAR